MAEEAILPQQEMQQNRENSASTTEAGGTTSSGDIDTSEHVVITYMVTGDKPDGQKAERLDEMLEKTECDPDRKSKCRT